jgi:hypothetical protein
LDSHTLKWPVGVIFITTIQKLAVDEVCQRWAHRTVRCTPDMSSAPATSSYPLGLELVDRWRLLSSCGTGQSGAHRTVRCLSDPLLCLMPRVLFTVRVDRWREVAVALLTHRTVRCTPDSPVNFSGAVFVKSRGCRVPEAASCWSTGHCPVYTGQSGEL